MAEKTQTFEEKVWAITGTGSDEPMIYDRWAAKVRKLLSAEVAALEERIRALEAQLSSEAQAHIVTAGTLQARIERAKKTYENGACDSDIIAALDGEPPSTATIIHAGPLKMKPIEPEPK
jgi:hypothetical protein